ncbi:MAG TPA: hypothetical protein VKB62_13900, partial [Streptosporangiaceae bacterium]|nr:hypothetical protein [Streptosporangiaceae bacterium]
AHGFSWLAGQRLLRTMALLIGLLNLTLAAATAVLVLLVRERLHLGPVGYGTLFTCEAAGGLIGSGAGDWLIRKVTATWTIRTRSSRRQANPSAPFWAGWWPPDSASPPRTGSDSWWQPW